MSILLYVSISFYTQCDALHDKKKHAPFSTLFYLNILLVILNRHKTRLTFKNIQTYIF